MSAERASRTLEVWQGEFGDAYTRRNVVDWRKRLPAFGKMLAGLSPARVLEIGCNRGHNLTALSELFGERCAVHGVEPNLTALRIARRGPRSAAVVPAEISSLPFPDGAFDLVLTAGVLIHIALGDLQGALREVHRVSSGFILSIEYYAEEETPIHYRGFDGLLWKRDFARHYLTAFPDLELRGTGYWTPAEGFDRSHWWLLRKS